MSCLHERAVSTNYTCPEPYRASLNIDMLMLRHAEKSFSLTSSFPPKIACMHNVNPPVTAL